MQIVCTLRNVKSFVGVFPPDLLTHSFAQTGIVIINADPHTGKVSHWLAIRFLPMFSSAHFFHSYGILPLVPAIQKFIRLNFTVWDYNKRQLQGLTSNVCGKFCWLFALCMDWGTHCNNLQDSSIPRTQIDRQNKSSFRILNCYADRKIVAGNAAPVSYKR